MFKFSLFVPPVLIAALASLALASESVRGTDTPQVPCGLVAIEGDGSCAVDTLGTLQVGQYSAEEGTLPVTATFTSSETPSGTTTASTTLVIPPRGPPGSGQIVEKLQSISPSDLIKSPDVNMNANLRVTRLADPLGGYVVVYADLARIEPPRWGHPSTVSPCKNARPAFIVYADSSSTRPPVYPAQPTDGGCKNPKGWSYLNGFSGTVDEWFSVCAERIDNESAAVTVVARGQAADKAVGTPGLDGAGSVLAFTVVSLGKPTSLYIQATAGCSSVFPPFGTRKPPMLTFSMQLEAVVDPRSSECAIAARNIKATTPRGNFGRSIVKLL